MKGNELLNKMELIDPAYVEAADFSPKIIKRNHIRWGVIAACICVLVGATTALAASDLGTQIINFFVSRSEPGSDYSESGYVLNVEIEKVPEKELKGKIKEAPALIRKQFENYNPYMDSLPEVFQKIFESRDEAYDYVGFDGLKRLDWSLKEKTTNLCVHGNEKGDILSVSVETLYSAGDINLQFFADIYTDNMKDKITIHTATTESTGFAESFYTTNSGKTLHIIDQSALESGYMTMDGYLVENSVLYRLHVSCPENDADQARTLIKQWADLFE